MPLHKLPLISERMAFVFISVKWSKVARSIRYNIIKGMTQSHKTSLGHSAEIDNLGFKWQKIQLWQLGEKFRSETDLANRAIRIQASCMYPALILHYCCLSRRSIYFLQCSSERLGPVEWRNNKDKENVRKKTKLNNNTQMHISNSFFDILKALQAHEPLSGGNVAITENRTCIIVTFKSKIKHLMCFFSC